jgi:uncharacterized SAM-binding protein YcdF (DUF218 family)
MEATHRRERERSRRRRWLVPAVVVVVLALVFIAVTARMFVWPDLPALPERVDAIIELGGPGDRDARALALAREHRADYLVQSTVTAEALTQRCLPAVPGVRIMCFHPDPNTTQGEAQFIGDLGRALGWTSVILVTTPDQAWRAKLRVERCFDGEVFVATTPLPARLWVKYVPYQWGATARALLVQRSC